MRNFSCKLFRLDLIHFFSVALAHNLYTGRVEMPAVHGFQSFGANKPGSGHQLGQLRNLLVDSGHIMHLPSYERQVGGQPSPR